MARSRTSRRFLIATALLFLIPLAGLWSFKRQGPLRHDTFFLVKKGSGINQLAEHLEREGVIRSATLFKLWAKAHRLKLIRGEYSVNARTSLSAILKKLQKGDIHVTRVVVIPGMHAWSLQKRLAPFVPKDVFWSLWKSPHLARTAGFPQAESLEGLIPAATYSLHRAMEPEEIMLSMVESFKDQIYPKLQGGLLDPYETLTLASLAEKETNLKRELPKVAGVYAKRLQIGMRLQCDPTSLYARWMDGDLRFTAPTGEDTRRPHPYNTYAISGLPPTPIAIPSLEAIEAAKHPQIGKDIFFVATGNGGHNFAPNFQQHKQNISSYRKELKRKKKR